MRGVSQSRSLSHCSLHMAASSVSILPVALSYHSSVELHTGQLALPRAAASSSSALAADYKSTGGSLITSPSPPLANGSSQKPFFSDDEVSSPFAQPPTEIALDEESFKRVLSRLQPPGDNHAEAIPSLDQASGWDSLISPRTLSTLVRACGNSGVLLDGKLVHKHILQLGLGKDRVLANFLIRMYGKCGALADAWQVFSDLKQRNEFTWSIMLRACLDCGSLRDARRVVQSMTERTAVTWNILIAAHAQKGRRKEALQLYHQMLSEMDPDRITFLSILPACCKEEALAQGKEIHAHIVKFGLESDCVVMNSLQNMYGKCGMVDLARGVFDKTTSRDIFSWNTMFSVYAQHGRGKEALELFSTMQSQGVAADHVSYVGLLDACARELNLLKGRKMHVDVVEEGFESDVVVGTALVNMYGKCGSLEDAQGVFMRLPRKDLVAWNAMTEAYAQCGWHVQAFELYQQIQLEGFTPDISTFLSLLSSCAGDDALHMGKQIHYEIRRHGLEADGAVKNALINMYSKCGSLDESWTLFSQMRQRNVVSWNAMITAFADHGQGQKALELFHDMHREGFTPNQVTILGALDACTSHNVLADGKRVHACIDRHGLVADKIIGSALIKMYSKCGSPEEAQKVFDETPDKDVVIWNALIAAYGQHGHGEKALGVFEQMKQGKAQPNESTFASVLSACSHGGLFEEGRSHFSSMTRYGVTPNVEHCNIMIDLLGRAGHLADAEDFLSKMSVKPNVTSFLTLLSACREHSDVERGKRVAKRLLDVSPESSGPYVLFSNICAAPGSGDALLDFGLQSMLAEATA